MKKNAVLMVLLCALLVGCNKYQDNNDSNQNSIELDQEEDLSYLIITYSCEDRGDQLYETIKSFDGLKVISNKSLDNGHLSAEGKNYYYDGLNCSYDWFSYYNNSVNDAYLHQQISIEYLDETLLRSKHSIDRREYVNVNDGRVDVYEHFHEYDGKKQVGFKSFLNGILVREISDYTYDGLNCSYTYKNYSNTGDLMDISQYEIQFLDDTYLRQKVTRYTTYVEGTQTKVYYKTVQYDGKKQIGYRIFVNGTMTEEGRDYIYDGLKCFYKVDYYRDGSLAHTSSFEVHYLE